MLPEHGAHNQMVNSVWNALRRFDVFPKYDSEVIIRSRYGGLGSFNGSIIPQTHQKMTLHNDVTHVGQVIYFFEI
jgi:hypothetical protein